MATNSESDPFPLRSKSPQQFEFISGLGNNYSGRVRAHVLRDHFRERQKKARRRPPNHDAVRSTGQPSSTSSSTGAEEESASEPANEMALVLSGKPGQHSCALHDQSTTGRRALQQDSSRNSQFSPYSVYSNAFKTFQISISPRQQYLVHHFAISSFSPLYRLNPKARFSPPRDISFPHTMTNEAGMMAIATVAAADIASMTDEGPSREVAEFQMQSLRLVQRRLEDPETRADDFTILFLIGFISILIEVFVKTKSEEDGRALRSHVSGLRTMVSQRGGLTTLACNPRIGWHLHWYDLVNSGEISAGLSPFSSHILRGLSALGDTRRMITPDPSCIDLQPSFPRLAILELVGFYDALYSLSVLGKNTNLSYLITIHSIQNLFPAGSPLLRILHEASITPAPDLPAVLIYLNALALDFHRADNVEVTQLHLQRLDTFFMQQRLAQTPSLYPILWTLMTNPDTYLLECPERVWLTAHLLWVIKRLGGDLQRRIEVALLAFIFKGDASGGTYGEVEDVWEPAHFAEQLWLDFGGNGGWEGLEQH